jgi:hypothetical protein
MFSDDQPERLSVQFLQLVLVLASASIGSQFRTTMPTEVGTTK